MAPVRPSRLSRVDTSIDSPNGSFDVLAIYRDHLERDPDITMPLAAISALLEVLTKTNASTVSEFTDILKRGKRILIDAVPNAYSLQAGCDIFEAFIGKSLRDVEDFDETKAHLVANGRLFISRAREARVKIAEIGAKFVKDGSTVLIHSYSRVVLAVLTRAAEENRRFRVFITESRPNGSGLKSKRVLERYGIPTCMLLDVAVGYAMPLCDMVLVGAEGVVENGGLINQIGTQNVAALAKREGKPFYCVAESHKFVRIYPLSQFDLNKSDPVLEFSDPPSRSQAGSALGSALGTPALRSSEDAFAKAPPGNGFFEEGIKVTSSSADVRNEHVMSLDDICNNPSLDLTPPEMITALVTDLGVLNPMSGVSEELIRLWY
ncbi:translation initiation factor eIF-2B subunit alpha [Protomyces lactucae-debilis]|uniref:Translation initiation factor eIF2B subunit alpha n=1 Tax=Protomyces lactucae-debilis TaxID=2754530 RepID=A0A1Y2FNR4_PROLT|nr:translation initiation factor eIF-2B subunit alpha [Protomyces lactucae-debilis]ORY85642.1 translation initiation factor eIF-2B subunit alpha [Protomyces lactucae-debilis]